MGVSGLFKFMTTKCSDEWEKVGLAEAVPRYRDETGRAPQLLIDINSCITPLCKERNYGCGRLKNFKAKWEKLLSDVHALGMEIIVVGKGLRRKCLWEKRNQVMWKRLNAVYRQGDCPANVYEDFDYPILYEIALEVATSSDKCQFRQPFSNELRGIVHHAKEHNGRGSFAVLTHNTDFVLAEGIPNCLSMFEFNLADLTTRKLNRNSLAKCLQLDPCQLPLFGSLCPSNVFSSDDLKGLYENSAASGERLFEQVTARVRGYPSGEEFLKNLASYPLNLGDAQMDILKDKLKDYLGIESKTDAEHMLTGDSDWDGLLRLGGRLMSEGRLQSNLFHVLAFKTMHLYQRGENTSEPTTVEHTPYDLLWDPNQDTCLREEKLRLFCRAIDGGLTPETLLSDAEEEEKFIFPTLAILYLEKLGKFTGSDLEAVLIQAICVNELSGKEMAEVAFNFDARAFNLGAWYSEVLTYLQYLNAACGFPFVKTSQANHFDMCKAMKREEREEMIGTRRGTFERLNRKLVDLRNACDLRLATGRFRILAGVPPTRASGTAGFRKGLIGFQHRPLFYHLYSCLY